MESVKSPQEQAQWTKVDSRCPDEGEPSQTNWAGTLKIKKVKLPKYFNMLHNVIYLFQIYDLQKNRNFSKTKTVIKSAGGGIDGT